MKKANANGNRAMLLFVDDEPNLINSLKRWSASWESEWECLFASGGKEALEIMERKHADVLVTDLRMPEMTGTELLWHVAQRHPGTARVILSAQADHDSTSLAERLAHRILTKPVPYEALRRCIEELLTVT